MRTSIVAVAVTCATLAATEPALAQVEGVVTAGVHRDVNHEQFGGASGGVLLTARWLSIGAQGDAFFSPPYVAGRFTPFVQGNVFDLRGVRLFLQAGKGYGEFKGTMYGAGIDLRRGDHRVGVRASLQAYLAQMWNGGKRAQPSVNVGVIWR